MIRIKENGGGVAILPGKCRWTTEPKFKLSSKESFQVLFLSSPHGVFSPKNTKTSQHWMHMQDELMGHFYTDGIRLSSQHSFFIYIIEFLTWICNSYLHRSMPPCVTMEARALTQLLNDITLLWWIYPCMCAGTLALEQMVSHCAHWRSRLSHRIIIYLNQATYHNSPCTLLSPQLIL